MFPPSHGGGGHDHSFADVHERTKVLDDPSRDEWQRPDEVMRALELLPAMVVADVGAGTGYFAVRLARLVPDGQVIATDAEPEMVRFLQERARHERLANVRVVAVSPVTSGLDKSSVDRILVVHVWHHLTERGACARDLAAALRPGGKLCIVEFSPTAERGPPIEMRLAPESLVAELTAVGLAAKVSNVALPDQYIVEARRGA